MAMLQLSLTGLLNTLRIAVPYSAFICIRMDFGVLTLAVEVITSSAALINSELIKEN